MEILPPYKYLDESKKKEIGYLTCKQTAIMLCRHEKFTNLFSIDSMKETFQWFDREKLFNFFKDLQNKYSDKWGMFKCDFYDAKMYTLADFLTFFVNYEPNLFSQIITEQLKGKILHKVYIKELNEIFLGLGYFYRDGFFYSASFNHETKAITMDFIGSKLKDINVGLYKTWISLPGEISSKNSDKATNISAKSRKLINGLLRELTPDLSFEKEEDDKIKKRLKKILGEGDKNVQIIEKVANLITTLNQTHAKGDHSFVDEKTAIFVYQLTELVIFFILDNKN